MEFEICGRRLVGRLGKASVCLLLAVATGCDVHEFPEDNPVPPSREEMKCVIDLHFLSGDMPLYTTVIYDPAAPGGIQARGNVGNDHDFRYNVNIYSAPSAESRGEAPGLVCSMVLTTSELDCLDTTIETRLPAGNYRILAWGDYVELGSVSDLYYIITVR